MSKQVTKVKIDKEKSYNNTDVAIIGGGIIGCSTAYYLAKRGIKVCVFEKAHRVAQEQSGRNWGFIRQLGRDSNELPIMIKSNKIWKGLEKELNANLGWQQGGILGMTDEEEAMSSYEDWSELAKQHNVVTKVLSSDQVDDLLPGMTKSWVGGIYVPSDGNADPDVTTQAFADGIKQNNGQVITNCTVLGIDTKAGAICGISTDRGYFKTNAVIVAAGAWSRQILSWLRIDLPQVRIRGTVGRTLPTSNISNIAAWTPKLGFVQRKDHCITFSGLDVSDLDLSLDLLKFAKYYLSIFMKHRDMVQLNFGHPFLLDLIGRIPGLSAMNDPLRRARIGEPMPNMHKLDRSMIELKKLFHATEDIKLKKAWAGHIEITPDMLPIIDDNVGPPGLIIVTGLSGHGFGIGPGVGSIVADMLTGENLSFDLDRFRLSRFIEDDWSEPYNLI